MESLPFIGPDVVKKHLKYSDLIPVVKRALLEYTQDRSAHPLRTAVAIPRSNGTMLTMPGYSSADHTFMTKMVGMYPDRIPSHRVYIAVFNPENGALQCVIVKNKPKVLAILGSGLQARSHIEAFCSVYEFEKINVWGRSQDNAQMVCDEYDQLPTQNCETIEGAVKDADVIVTVTHASQPILFGKWLKEGSHVNCVGACRPTMRECDDDCLTNATVYADSRESAENESGDVILSKADVYAEIGEILLGKKPPRYGHHTFFKSLGLAIEDAVAANLVWRGVNNELQST